MNGPSPARQRAINAVRDLRANGYADVYALIADLQAPHNQAMRAGRAARLCRVAHRSRAPVDRCGDGGRPGRRMTHTEQQRAIPTRELVAQLADVAVNLARALDLEINRDIALRIAAAARAPETDGEGIGAPTPARAEPHDGGAGIAGFDTPQHDASPSPRPPCECGHVCAAHCAPNSSGCVFCPCSGYEARAVAPSPQPPAGQRWCERADKNHFSICKAWPYLSKHADHIDGEVANANDDQRRLVGQLLAELEAAQKERDEAKQRLRSLCDDVMRCIPADWCGDKARNWGEHLGNVLAEYIDDVRATLAATEAKLKEATGVVDQDALCACSEAAHSAAQRVLNIASSDAIARAVIRALGRTVEGDDA